jgi:hypothetical protein
MATTKPGKITSTKPAPAAAAAPAADTGDTSLPDATRFGKIFLGISLLLTLGVAVLLPAEGWDTRTFVVPSGISTQFGLLAGFYVAAQVIERLMELITHLLPTWKPPPSPDTKLPETGVVGAAYTKADRAACSLGVASLLGVAASASFGLYFVSKFGIHTKRWVDIFVTGVVIGAGTKPLHDFISLIQNSGNPKTGSGTG